MRTILLIDDDRLSTKHLETYVIGNYPHIRLNSCNNPLEALPLLKGIKYDLILLDIEMPLLDGRKLMLADAVCTAGWC